MYAIRSYYEKYGAQSVFDADRDFPDKKRIGINRSFLVNTYYPLYSTFFAKLGFKIVIPDSCSQKGIDQKNAPFCYPAELAHGVITSYSIHYTKLYESSSTSLSV